MKNHLGGTSKCLETTIWTTTAETTARTMTRITAEITARITVRTTAETAIRTTAETTARITAETARTAKTDIKTVNVEELLHGAIRAQLLFLYSWDKK